MLIKKKRKKEIVEGYGGMAGGNLISVGCSGVVQWRGMACEGALNVPEDVCMGWVERQREQLGNGPMAG